MSPRTRLSAEERRTSILIAATQVFAVKGFKGTTTKEIAKAAGVSEALLYRHFPSKENIYLDLRDYICDHKDEFLEYMSALPTSTETLVFFTHFLIHHIFLGGDDDHLPGLTQHHLNRLMVNSFLEDGAFARLFLDHTLKKWKPFLLECVEAADQAGHLYADEMCPVQKIWFVEHIAVALNLFSMPQEPVIDYHASATKVARNATFFALRGIGLKEEVIQQLYKPETFPDIEEIVKCRKTDS